MDETALESEWRQRLPALILELSTRWSLQLGQPFEGHFAWVAPAGEVNGEPVVLKIGMPHREARTEAGGLRFFDGTGAVRLFESDEEAFALLEERCVPGDDLWVLDAEEGNTVAVEVLEALWRPMSDPASPIEYLCDIVEEWIEQFSGQRIEYSDPLVDLATTLARDLAMSASDQVVVLHGDFNPGNVLASGRGWLSIDPKPLVGDPAYDLATLLANRAGQGIFPKVEGAPEIERQVDFFAEALGVDWDRMVGWTVVKSLAWRWGVDTAEYFAGLLRQR